VALTSPGVVTTAVDGTGTFTVVYPEDHALWVQVTLTAKATVSGTESSTSTTFVLADARHLPDDYEQLTAGIRQPVRRARLQYSALIRAGIVDSGREIARR